MDDDELVRLLNSGGTESKYVYFHSDLELYPFNL